MCISGTKMNRFWFWTGSILTPFHLFSRSFDRERSLARMVGNKLSLHGPARIVGLSFAAKILLSVWSHIHTNRHEHRHNRAKIFYARIIALPYETKNVRLIWKGNDARVKYLGAVMSMLMRAENFSSRMEGQWCARKIFWRGHVDAHARRKFFGSYDSPTMRAGPCRESLLTHRAR